MDKGKMLFLDDRTKRIHAALEQYGDEYDVTIVVNPLECLRLLSSQEWNLVSMDFDLGGVDFTPMDSPNNSYAIYKYIKEFGWPHFLRRPVIWIHSTNRFAGDSMAEAFRQLGFHAEYRPFEYRECNHDAPKGTGIVAGCFDVIHPGYIALLKDAKKRCDYLIVALHEDPSMERPEKAKPVLNVQERREILLSIRYVNEVVVYRTEEDLHALIVKKSPGVIIVGDDHKDGPVTGKGLKIPIYYHKRLTGWSATKFREAIRLSFQAKEEEHE